MTPDIMFLAQQYFKGHAILKEQEIWIINVREDIVHNIMLEMNKRMPYTILTVTKTVWPQGVELWHRQYIQGKSVERHAVRIY
jgi:hypothetical protein